jgi:hypothetical protein
LATRFGLERTHSRENRQTSQIGTPDNNQTKLSDGVNLFSTGALADGVTVEEGALDIWGVDAGFKKNGSSLHLQYHFRTVQSFEADGPLPLKKMTDSGFYVQAGRMTTPKKIQYYAVYDYIFGQFNDAWETGGGIDIYPYKSRDVKLNFQGTYVNHCPQGSLFGYYTAGQTGAVLSANFDILF